MLRFGDFPLSFCAQEQAKIVLQPIPFDKTSTWKKGARKGPNAILKASQHLEWFNQETETEVYKQGIYTTPPIRKTQNINKLVVNTRKITKEYLDQDKFVVSIGGEHSISIGPIMAYADHYPALTVVQFDAHADLRETYQGSRYNHACVMSRAKEYSKIFQIGLRSMDQSEYAFIRKDKVIFAHEIWNQKALQKLNTIRGPVYITFDLDVLDPSLMPSTGTPEPGGLFYRDVIDIISKMSQQTKIVGFDVVELCPSKNNHAADFTAARLIYDMLGFAFA